MNLVCWQFAKLFRRVVSLSSSLLEPGSADTEIVKRNLITDFLSATSIPVNVPPHRWAKHTLDGIKENKRLEPVVEKFLHFPPTLLISPGNLKKIENLWKFKYQRQKFPFRNWLIETLKYDLSWFIRSNLVSSRSCISFLGTKRQLNQTPPWDWSSGNATNTFESRWPTSYLPPGRSHNWKYWT